jgi:hypothetical protein
VAPVGIGRQAIVMQFKINAFIENRLYMLRCIIETKRSSPFHLSHSCRHGAVRIFECRRVKMAGAAMFQVPSSY